MPAFLYFLPDHRDPVFQSTLGKFGIEYAFDTLPTGQVGCKGPAGQQGSIVADARIIDESRIGYFPEKQEWLRVPGSLAWAGMYQDARPSSGDLQRVTQLRGQFVQLADGGMWQIPTARSWEEGSGGKIEYAQHIPRTVGLDENGEWVARDVLACYRELWQIDGGYYRLVMGLASEAEKEAEFRGTNLFNSAAVVLRGNYRVSGAECSLLGLFTFEHAKAILDALIQRELLMELYQKKMTDLLGASSGLSSSAGPEVSPPATAPAA